MNTNGTRKLIGDEQHDAFHASIPGHQFFEVPIQVPGDTKVLLMDIGYTSGLWKNLANLN